VAWYSPIGRGCNKPFTSQHFRGIFVVLVTRSTPISGTSDKSELYSQAHEQLSALLRGETDQIANTANAASLLYRLLPDVNWFGFYFLKDGELVLGPFQGKPACTRIKLSEGVCGKAAAEQTTVIVPDVNAFPGHIACDTASQSEIAVPLLNWGNLVGVLDVDSPAPNRFDEEDAEGLEIVASILLETFVTDYLPDLSEEAASE
jgi:L-methionine (R)-S-oxide reductase